MRLDWLSLVVWSLAITWCIAVWWFVGGLLRPLLEVL
jgi:hypothetical protein